MAVKFDLPSDIEERLRASVDDLDLAAKEAALANLYRAGRLTQADLGKALGLGRLQIDAFLKRHLVHEDLITIEEHAADVARLRRLAG